MRKIGLLKCKVHFTCDTPINFRARELELESCIADTSARVLCKGNSMGDDEKKGEVTDWVDGTPMYQWKVTDLRFLNVSIKTHDKKTGGGFPREEYYAYRIVSM